MYSNRRAEILAEALLTHTLNRSLIPAPTPSLTGVAPLRRRAPSYLRRSRTGFVRHLLAEFSSIEAAFTLFLFAGWYKNLVALSWFPVDVTLIFFVATLWLIAVAVIYSRIKSFSPGSETFLLVLFSTFALVSLLCSSLEATRFLTATIFLVAHMIAEERERRQRFVRMLLWFTSAFVLYYAYCRYVRGMSMQAGDDAGPGNYLEYGFGASIPAYSLHPSAAAAPGGFNAPKAGIRVTL